ncbi:PASTA domain-containing protein [Paenibacillus allorhizosphaerae]|uniref:PASTA domain-containing protein n=1 Tax=Paenibacillus allorhizosphaerae TaxID=2849866 RepID=A0ABM8VCP8_9BACL|nr:PASTA domain-containing protein [Paenibacillus allorhizosphaerae]CAG7624447.1 hypothetical protein PAECIP111802_01065 [Paenibacillus allorhizosphaerae]
METIRQRYLPEQCIQQQPLGKLYKGKDLFFNRDVMCFVLEPTNETVIGDYVQSIRKVSQFSDERFMHVLDIDVNPDRIMAILKPGAGRLIIDELEIHKFGEMEMIKLVMDLGYGMHEAKKEGITGYSVRADNLCLSSEQGLSVINYWEQGNPNWIGAAGLCRLLYQFVMRSFEAPEDPDTLCGELQERLVTLDADQSADIAGRIRRVLTGEATLPHLLSGFDKIVSRHEGQKVLQRPAPSVPFQKKDIIKTAPSVPAAKTEIKTFRWNRKWVIGCSALLVLLVGELAFITLMKKPELPPEETAAVSKQDTVPIAQQAGPKLTETVAAAAETPENQESTSTPTLTGFSQEVAEKQALAYGLRYQYFIEPHEQIKGTVFKQDPAPNVTVPKGTQITFWVSKGNK